MALLRSALFQAERVGARPNAVLLIRSDDALKSLERRDDFAELLANP
jgi:hypothetical protein